MKYITNLEIPEVTVLDVLGDILSDEGWEVIDRIERLALPNVLTKPRVLSAILDSETKRHTFKIPRDAVNSYVILRDRIPYVFIDEEVENTDGSVSITVSGASNGASAGSPVEITVWMSELVGKKDYKLGVGYAKHLIVRNNSGNLFGIANYGYIQRALRYFDFFPDNLPFFMPVLIGRPRWGTKLEPNDDSAFYNLMGLIESQYMENNSIYLYQLFKYTPSNSFMESHIIGIDSDDPKEIRRAALDMEVYTTAWEEIDALKFEHKITQKYNEENYQGPIVRANYRREDLESWEEVGGVDYKITNWWSDSKIRISGTVDDQTAALVVVADTAPVKGQDASVPTIPVYFGDFSSLKGGETIDGNFERSYVFDFKPNGDRKYIPVVSPYPIDEATIELWLSGDLNFPEHGYWFRVFVDQYQIVSLSEAYSVPPAETRDKANYKGIYLLGPAIGKTRFTIALDTSSQVRNGNPALRAWVVLRVSSSINSSQMDACLFAGHAPPQPKFDFDNPNKSGFREQIFPLLKAGKNIEAYPQFPSNGIDTVQVKLTKYGARYQEYYIAWNTPSNLIPPPREGQVNKVKHPRAWNNFNSDVYRYQFNPSQYDDVVHVSKAYLVHPEDGVHGTLRNVVLLNPLSILTGDEIELETDGCSQPQPYVCYTIEGISPLTKRPGTPYRPALLALKKGESQ